MTANRRILVIGAGGFLGRHIVRRLRADRSLTVIATARHPLATPESGQVQKLDGSDPAAVHSLIADLRPDAIVNAAGRRIGSDSDQQRANLVVAETLAEAARRYTPGIRFIQLGSAAEYGRTGHLRVAEHEPCRPVSVYGRTKLAATESLLAFDAESDIRVVVLRLFNVVGPGMSADSAPGAWLARLRASPDVRRVPMGRLDAVRDFISADDVASAVLLALGCDLRAVVINICSGRGTSIEALLRRMAAVSGIEAEFQDDPALGWEGDPDRMVGDPSLAKRLLGFVASPDLDSTLAETVFQALRAKTAAAAK
jgi:nucleoside-diphosphate-sugar epimerase